MLGTPTVRQFKSIWGVGVVLATTGPLIVWLNGYEPPWPETWPAFHACVSITIAAIGIIIGAAITISKARAKCVGVICLCFGLLLCGLYCYLTVLHVEIVPQVIAGKERAARFVIGKQLLPGLENNLNSIELLKRYGRPENIWTRDSLTSPRFSIMATFYGTFFCINVGLSLLAGANVTHKIDLRSKIGKLPT